MFTNSNLSWNLCEIENLTFVHFTKSLLLFCLTLLYVSYNSTICTLSRWAFQHAVHEVVRSASRVPPRSAMIAVSWEVAKRSRSRRAFADCFVCFVCLHARDNSRRSRRRRHLSFSRGATFLMQVAPFLFYKSYCGVSRALRIHTGIRAAGSRACCHSLHSRSDKGCSPRASRPIRRMKEDI